MLEALNSQPDPETLRPIGRFLLGMEDYEGQNKPFDYAAAFASRPGNFHKYKHKSLKIKDIEELSVDSRSVQLEFAIDHSAYIWKIIVAAEQRRTEDIATNYITHGGERYELYCSDPKPYGKYYEYNAQGMAIRERDFDDETIIDKLQGVVERLIGDQTIQ